MAIFQGTEYHTEGNTHKVRVGALWRDFDPTTGQYGAFTRAPGPAAVRHAWRAPNPNPNPGPQLPPPPPRQPAQPMTANQRLGVFLFAIVAAVLVAIWAISGLSPTRQADVNPPAEKVRAIEVEVVPNNLVKTDAPHPLQNKGCVGNEGKTVKVDSGKKDARGRTIWDYYKCR